MNLGCNEPKGAASTCINCGALNAACCEGDNCQDGGRCLGGVCKACGAVDGPCCKGGTCTAGGTICSFNTSGEIRCLQCGASGQPCCSEDVCAAGLTCKKPVAAGKPSLCSK